MIGRAFSPPKRTRAKPPALDARARPSTKKSSCSTHSVGSLKCVRIQSSPNHRLVRRDLSNDPIPHAWLVSNNAQLPRFRYQLAPTFPTLHDLTERSTDF